VGLATSGVWSVWEIERAEKRAQIKDLERTMLTDLDDTALVRDNRGARMINAATSGTGPLIGIVVPLLPYLLEGIVLSMLQATGAAVFLGVCILFVFGAYMGSIADLDWRIAGIRMGLAGLVVAAINILLPG
jgi:predicted membrane protein (TIGR00267 family)